MKKSLTLVIILLSFVGWAQPDDIVYYEDSRVKNSRFGFALVLNPNYTDRRLINDEIPAGGGFDLVDNKAAGSFALNYGLDIFYSIGSSLDIGVGIGRAEASFGVENAQLYNTPQFDFGVSDTLLVSATTDVNMYTIPIKLNFNTSISEVFDLEVVPTVELLFMDSYKTTFEAAGVPAFTRDFTEQTRNFNSTVGISLGGTYYFAPRWGFFLRFNARYMLNSMIEMDDYPRETLYSFGSNLGLKFRF